MNEREWALVLAYMRGETKPLLDYIYEELGSADLKYSADRALSIVGKGAKYIATHDPRIIGYRNAMWFWNKGRNYLLVFHELPAKGFFKAKDVCTEPRKVPIMNDTLPTDYGRYL